MTSTDEHRSNADAAAAKVGALAGLYAAGALTRQAFVMVLYAAKVRAARTAEATLWRWSLEHWSEPIAPMGIIPSPDVMDSLRAAAETITEDDEPADELDEEKLTLTISELSRGAVSFRSGIEIVTLAVVVQPRRDLGLERLPEARGLTQTSRRVNYSGRASGDYLQPPLQPLGEISAGFRLFQVDRIYCNPGDSATAGNTRKRGREL